MDLEILSTRQGMSACKNSIRYYDLNSNHMVVEHTQVKKKKIKWDEIKKKLKI